MLHLSPCLALAINLATNDARDTSRRRREATDRGDLDRFRLHARCVDAVRVIGIALSGVAYLPQVVHLGRQHCSAGVSRPASALWVASSLLIGAQALSSRNLVFCALQVMNPIASIAIFRVA
jgi:hypothetical protein